MIFYIPIVGREINTVKFSSDGRKILAGLSNKKLLLIDVETGQNIRQYDNCCFSYNNSRDFLRIPIAVDSLAPYLAVTTYTNGKGIFLVDLREPIPFEHFDLHNSNICDIMFLNNSWPFGSKSTSIATLTYDGICKISTIDGKILQCFEVGHKTTTLDKTPEPFNLMSNNGYRSSITLGGDSLSSYTPEPISNAHEKLFNTRTLNLTTTSNSANNSLSSNLVIPDINYLSQFSNHFRLNQLSSTTSHLTTVPSSNNTFHSSLSNHHSNRTHNIALFAQCNRRINSLINTKPLENNIFQLKYGSNGGILYTTTNSNAKYCVQNYRRFPNDHRLLGELYSHKSDIYDFDISRWDEFIITASRDKSVGVMCLGSPNHGSTSVMNIK